MGIAGFLCFTGLKRAKMCLQCDCLFAGQISQVGIYHAFGCNK